jgi:hypothetical protein
MEIKSRPARQSISLRAPCLSGKHKKGRLKETPSTFFIARHPPLVFLLPD